MGLLVRASYFSDVNVEVGDDDDGDGRLRGGPPPASSG